ncbi:hypothetical protein GTW51_16540 [Aurantimonas aggregata]|uniref:Uncharacterized protein n=1 Tax=Aurantimonas aggregata TaxID=2047720 RepID=A0A6L9MLE7_9HYPH|nr:hypothetical protein [Aurantimonas aggregata]NDV88310.1 hypothetical protein [Aurantimonas aggregata]
MEHLQEFLDLPSDPEEAFAVYQSEKWKQLNERLRVENRPDWSVEREYVDAIIAFDEVYSLSFFDNYKDVPSDDNFFGSYYKQFVRLSAKLTLKINLEAARRIKSSGSEIVVLDPASRSAIRQLIDAIRQNIDTLSISEEKRRTLFRKLNAFAAEIDQNLTRVEAFKSFALEVNQAAANASEEWRPVWERVDRVLGMLDSAKHWVESLPAWSERKKLEGPKKQLAAPQTKDLEDEIPF